MDPTLCRIIVSIAVAASIIAAVGGIYALYLIHEIEKLQDEIRHTLERSK